MKIPFVDLKKQYHSIKEEILETVGNVMENSAFIGGSFVEKFESDFAEFCGTKYCIGVGNGTDAIFIALKILGIGPDDEVITVANSFIATSEAISLTGAKVVFCDVSEDTRNIDPDLIADKITGKTRAIVPVHLYGQPANMDEIMNIAKKYNLFVVEDAAQAHGARYKGKIIGTIGDVGCFSFYPGKNLGAYGDGGAIITDNSQLAKKMRMYANHGRTKKYDHEFEGINSRLDGIQAAILNVKLKYLKEWSVKRNNNAKIYNIKLKVMEDVITPRIQTDREHIFHLYVIQSRKRDDLREYLSKNGISTGIHYPIALPNLIAYKYLKYAPDDFPISSKLQNEILSLPMYPELTEEEIDYVVYKIKEFYNKENNV
ncbi:dTDP-3-amino-3,4,6-trideoxy-alpha-D-glucose transaminase [subsurface metagenome]|nr:aminotransferase class V-fold PLP-dependent enzyme [Clostridia bacterium]